MASFTIRRECRRLICAASTSNGLCFMSSKPQSSSIQKDLIVFDVEDKTGIATMSLNSPPLNTFDIELLKAVKSSIKEVEKNNVRGLILTSSIEKIFSAGFDVSKLYTTNREELTELISLAQDVTEDLHLFPFPTAALINGHALGGGCGIAATCEYRVMLPKYRIGMVEAAVGVVPQAWTQNLILEVLDRRTTELALTQAKQFRADEALRVGLVDEIVSDKAEGMVKCQQFFQCFKGVNSIARTQTKKQFRSKLFTDKQVELKSFVDELLQPRTQAIIGAYLNSLKKKVV